MQEWGCFIATAVLLVSLSRGDELTFLQHGTSLACVARGQNSSASVKWVPHLNNSVMVTQKSYGWLPTPPQKYRDLGCTMSTPGNVNCSKLKDNNADWRFVNTWGYDYGILTDQRWHDLPLQRISGDREFIIEPVPNLQAVTLHISVLAKNSLVIFLAETQDFKTSREFRLVIDNINPDSRFLSWCDHGTSSCKPIETKPGLILSNGTQWTNLRITFDKRGEGSRITLYNDHSKETDAWKPHGEKIDFNYLLIRTIGTPGYIKFHKYYAMQSVNSRSPWWASIRTAEWSPPSVCLSVIYWAPTDPASLQLLSHYEGQPTYGILHSAILQDGEGWQHWRYKVNVNPSTMFVLSITPPAVYTQSDGRLTTPDFVIGDIRVCQQNEAFILKLEGSGSGHCSNGETSSNTASVGSFGKSFLYPCRDGTFSSYCSVRCSDVFPTTSSCGGVQFCNHDTCSCLPGFYGNNCERTCLNGHGPTCESCSSNCHQNQCDVINGTCTACPPGRDGQYCEEFSAVACTEGRYGPRCVKRCSEHCKGNKCDVTDGACTDGCQPGWTQPQCNQACPYLHFGDECREVCSVNCGGYYRYCHHVTGACKDGCKGQRSGQFCESCVAGRYGSDCNSWCSIYCNSSRECNASSGECFQGCRLPGWMPPLCNEKCQSGWYGDGCRQKCSVNCKGDCDVTDGTCVAGCKPNWSGLVCLNCSEGWYGSDCSDQCSQHCQQYPCDPINGNCPLGLCMPGWKSPLCKTPCDAGSYGADCGQSCSVNCQTPSQCDHLNGTCHGGCEEQWRPPICEQKRAVSPELTFEESGTDNIQVKVPEVNPDQISQIILQYRKVPDSQSDEEVTTIVAKWENGTSVNPSGRNQVAGFTNLSPDQSYQFRAVLVEKDGGSYQGRYIPTYKRRTLCVPAGEEQMNFTSQLNSIKLTLDVERTDGFCDYHTYSVNFGGNTVTLLEDFSVEMVGLEPGTNYSVSVRTINKNHQFVVATLEELTEPLPLEGPPLELILIPLVVILVVILGGVFWRRKRVTCPQDQQMLQPTDRSTNPGGIALPVLLQVPDISTGSSTSLITHSLHPNPNPDKIKPHARTVKARAQSPSSPTLPLRPSSTPDRSLNRASAVPKMSPDAPFHSYLVSVTQLTEYVDTAMTSGLLKSQHALFPRGQTSSWDEGRRPEHHGKNRYGNLVAYDDTRVCLTLLPKQPHSHYINANYIDGYQHPRAYIATQGPKDSTLGDFWRMVWQENVSTIVMVANLIENGKGKCEQYWPDEGQDAREMGGVSVITVSEKTLLHYTVRELRASKDKQTRQVFQLHYTTWPDHGVPTYPYTVAVFLRHTMSTMREKSPLLVHCSAGVGRTGTVILAHACLQMARAEATVDALALLSTMRSQRPNMVDNHTQYEMAHKILLELLFVEDTSIPSGKFPARRRNLKESHGFTKEFSGVQEACQSDVDNSETLSWPHDKNRFQHIVPVCSGRVMLNGTASEYINAAYIDGAGSKARYIVTQLPLPTTLGDFWLMVWQRSSIVVLLNTPDPFQDQSTCEMFSDDHSEVSVSDKMRVKVLNVSERKIFQIRSIEITYDEIVKKVAKTGCREVTVISMNGWKTGQVLPDARPQDLVQILDEVDRGRKDECPVIVTCHDGASASGVFVAASHAIDGLKLIDRVDVGGAVRGVRHNRPHFVKCKDQYEFLYDVVQAYCDTVDTYANVL